MWLLFAILINIVPIICLTILAIIFNKWWIVLFSILFLFDVKHIPLKKYYRICDGCGKRSPDAKDYNTALEEAKKAGWITRKNWINDKFEDYCPECQVKFKTRYPSKDYKKLD